MQQFVLTRGNEAAQRFIFSAIASSTRFTTNSCVRRMFRAVSFGTPGERSPGHRPTMGGESPSTLKKLNGAAFTRPSRSTVVVNAIGRGVTSPARIM
jgi:hypothetical protein